MHSTLYVLLLLSLILSIWSPNGAQGKFLTGLRCSTKEHKRCIFPFKYNGKTHHKCINEDTGYSFWCPTSRRFDGTSKDPHWGVCVDSFLCPIPNTKEIRDPESFKRVWSQWGDKVAKIKQNSRKGGLSKKVKDREDKQYVEEIRGESDEEPDYEDTYGNGDEGHDYGANINLLQNIPGGPEDEVIKQGDKTDDIGVVKSPKSSTGGSDVKNDKKAGTNKETSNTTLQMKESEDTGVIRTVNKENNAISNSKSSNDSKHLPLEEASINGNSVEETTNHGNATNKHVENQFLTSKEEEKEDKEYENTVDEDAPNDDYTDTEAGDEDSNKQSVQKHDIKVSNNTSPTKEADGEIGNKENDEHLTKKVDAPKIVLDKNSPTKEDDDENGSKERDEHLPKNVDAPQIVLGKKSPTKEDEVENGSKENDEHLPNKVDAPKIVLDKNSPTKDSGDENGSKKNEEHLPKRIDAPKSVLDKNSPTKDDDTEHGSKEKDEHLPKNIDAPKIVLQKNSPTKESDDENGSKKNDEHLPKKVDAFKSVVHKHSAGSIFNQQVLDAHNKARQTHHAPPLQLSPELNDKAQAWADHLAKIDELKHSGPGENLYMGNEEPQGKDPVDAWLEEEKDFNYGQTTFSLKTGHFTQVVWKGSKKLGVGKATSKTGMRYVVAQYSPPGNMNTPEEFNKNVARP